jgi:predicted nicotinamide N-methyase
MNIDPPPSHEETEQAAMQALGEDLERRFRTTTTQLHIGGRQLDLVHPAKADELIDEDAFDRDERLPYWADIWPAARALAVRVSAMHGRGQSLLELGCGAGLVATCAALAGFEVCATDYYEEALHFTQLNVWRNTGYVPRTRLADWRRLPTDLGRHDVVVGSDVLYERPYGELVARAIDITLNAHGEVLVADPGRIATEQFLQAIAERGLRVVGHERDTMSEGTTKQTIDVYRLRRGRR